MLSIKLWTALWLILTVIPSCAESPPKDISDISDIKVPGKQQITVIERKPPMENPDLSPKEMPSYSDIIRKTEISLALGVFAFGGVVILIVNLIIWRMGLNRSLDRDHIDALVGINAVIIVITATMFLITAGYSDRQIAPAMGLFGTIMGYMLGTRSHIVRERLVGTKDVVSSAGVGDDST
jgi:hypothetical protein